MHYRQETEKWMLVFSFTSLPYSAWAFSPWYGATHSGGESFYPVNLIKIILQRQAQMLTQSR